jgi:hypothetical protein
MKIYLAILFSLALGYAAGLLYGIPHKNSRLQTIRKFDPRPTVGAKREIYPLRDGTVRSVGSEEIAFIDGKFMVTAFLIRDGAREKLREFEVDADWFRSVHFTVAKIDTKRVGLLMNARSILKSADSRNVPKGRPEGSLFDEVWDYDLGPVASVFGQCNQLVTSSPSWQPDHDTPAICYQFSRTKVDTKPRYSEGTMPISENAMLSSSRSEQDLGFVLVTVRVLN